MYCSVTWKKEKDPQFIQFQWMNELRYKHSSSIELQTNERTNKHTNQRMRRIVNFEKKTVQWNCYNLKIYPNVGSLMYLCKTQDIVHSEEAAQHTEKKREEDILCWDL